MVNLEGEEAARKAAEKETAAQSKRVKRAVKQTAGSAAGTIGREVDDSSATVHALLISLTAAWLISLKRISEEGKDTVC